ncbi:hypothetical protein ACJZ2D_002065 [Fusarium nematophilum]
MNNTYKTLRVIGEGYNLMHAIWCTNEYELYDMKTDLYQMKNLYTISERIGAWDIGKLRARLDALLLILKSCSGRICTHRWEVLHPEGNIANLEGAMATNFDDFYDRRPKISFSGCGLGYFPALEGPQDAHTFGDSASGHRPRWEDWV